MLKILFVNWRDLSNPAGGGAERFTEEIGRRLVDYGNQVTIFTSSFDHSEPETIRHGIRIIRHGGKYTVYFRARNYVKKHSSEYDIIVDEINTVPFRIRKIVKSKPVVAVIHQLAREIWFYETRFPANVLGYYMFEPFWLKEYRPVHTITVSDSTRDQLLALGFEQVDVVHNGISMAPVKNTNGKEDHPVLIFLGRLVRSKLPDHAIAAFRLVKDTFPESELWILGDGYLRKELESQAPEGVKFFGRVDEHMKAILLQKAHVLMFPSVREGWGLSVMEANSVGTPAVGYDIPGLRDSIQYEKTGLLTEPMNIQGLASGALRILNDRRLAQNLSHNAVQWSTNFNWDAAAKSFGNILDENVRRFEEQGFDQGSKQTNC